MRVTLFLTHSLSLKIWDEQGIFDRELALYRKLQADYGVSFQLVTYGGRDELAYRPRLNGMRILCNWVGWSEKRYTQRLHQLHGLRLWQSDLYKTNQLNGAQVAVKASRLWKRPLIVRFGYLWSAFAEQNHAPDSDVVRHVHRIQNEAFTHAQQVVMTSTMMLDDVRAIMPAIDAKTTIIPNYVDTDLFRPLDVAKQYDLVFVGRVTAQKNLESLLNAIRQTDYTLAIAGDGDLRESLQQSFSDLAGRVHWLGRVNHGDLPELINQGRAFILPSLYEGHPKSLIEAMACGVPVIGTRVRGIQQVIDHQQNGILCEPTRDSILSTITSLLSSTQIQGTLSQSAREFVLNNYSLDTIAQAEYNLYNIIHQRHERI